MVIGNNWSISNIRNILLEILYTKVSIRLYSSSGKFYVTYVIIFDLGNECSHLLHYSWLKKSVYCVHSQSQILLVIYSVPLLLPPRSTLGDKDQSSAIIQPSMFADMVSVPQRNTNYHWLSFPYSFLSIHMILLLYSLLTREIQPRTFQWRNILDNICYTN